MMGIAEHDGLSDRETLSFDEAVPFPARSAFASTARRLYAPALRAARPALLLGRAGGIGGDGGVSMQFTAAVCLRSQHAARGT